MVWYFKAFALTGRQVCVRNNPGRCPGLGASALSGRAASGAFGLYLCFTLRPAIFNSLRPVTVGSGRADYTFLGVWVLPEFLLLL